jgi:uncharacterized membrane protein
MLVLMRSHLKGKVAMMGLAPVLFWMLAAGIEIARRDPEAFETPFVYLAATWLLYLPVFGLAGVLLIGAIRLVRFRTVPLLLSFGAVGGACLAVLCLSIASSTYRLPMRVWPLCFVVGAAMGIGLTRREFSRAS